MIVGSINAMIKLCDIGLFDLRFLMSALQQIVPFLAHPVKIRNTDLHTDRLTDNDRKTNGR